MTDMMPPINLFILRKKCAVTELSTLLSYRYKLYGFSAKIQKIWKLLTFPYFPEKKNHFLSK